MSFASNNTNYTNWVVSKTQGQGQAHAHTAPVIPVGVNLTTYVKPCDIQGHEIDKEFVQYMDGLLASYCTRCGSRITMQAIPAGDIPYRVRGLLADLLGHDDLPQGFLENLQSFRDDLVALDDALEESKELLVVLESVMAKKIS